MDLTGRMHDLTKDFKSGKLIVSLIVNEVDFVVPDEDLDISIKKHKKKRSLDANAYAWVLISKLASVLHTSKEEVYEEMLRRYGVIYKDDDGYITVTVKDTVDMSKISGHWMHYKDKGNFKSYLMIKGSSEYDTTEMAHFIDGIVSDCKEQGIETLTPDQLLELKNAWKQ